MKRRLDLTESRTNSADDTVSLSLKNTLIASKDCQCLVTIRSQFQLTYFAYLDSPQVSKRNQCLLELTKNILQLTVQNQSHVVERLLDRFDIEEHKGLKVMIVLVFQKISALPHFNPVLLLGKLVSFLSSKSTKVRCQLYKAITNLLKTRQVILNPTTEEQLQRLFDRVLEELSESHHRIRSECVSLLSVLPKVFANYKGARNGSNKIMSEMEVQSVISKYVLDADPRVRRSSLNALVEIHLCGYPLDQPLYYLAVQSLSDDFEEVRLRGLDLVWSLCSLYPDYTMPLANENLRKKVRLIDDAFSRVCDLVNDVSVVVRTKACVMLASYHDVEPNILAQTFSKQIMSRLKHRIPGNQTEQHDQSRYSKQNKDNQGKWNNLGKDSGPKKGNSKIRASGDINVNDDEFRVLDSGACGAFIHGLEDEYQEVRSAAIDSICELCMYHESLIKQAVICLVDMFNDEIDKIRINAIQSLRKIGSKTTLNFNSEELEVTLGAFEDSDKMAREAAHDLMKVTRLYSAEDLEKLLLALMANVKRYPEDKLSILRCLCEVGKKHDDYIESLVPSLLHLDKRYIAREQPVSDYSYTANAVLIINACATNPNILSMLPPHMMSHFSYYKRKYADCVPDLHEIIKNNVVSMGDGVNYVPSQLSLSVTESMMVDVEDYISITMTMITTLHDQVKRLDFDAALATLVAAHRSLEYIATLNSIHSETSYLAILYLRCYQIVIQARKNQTSSLYAITAQKTAASLFQYSYQMQYSFLGLPTETLQAAMYFRLLGNMIWLFGVMKQGPTSTTSPVTIQNMIHAFVCRVDVIQKNFSPDFPYYTAIVNLRSNLTKALNRPTTVNMASLHAFITDFLPLDIGFTKAVKRTWSVIISPTPNLDKPVKFDPIFPVELKFEATLSHALDISQIGIEVILPDQTSLFFWPSSSQFIPTFSDCHKLITSVSLHLSTWKETDTLTCRIVRSFDPDLAGLDNYITRFSDSSSKSAIPSTSIPGIQNFSTIVISEHLVIHLSPMS
ncbi:unnamed protein product [Absidia cylindrospora]